MHTHEVDTRAVKWALVVGCPSLFTHRKRATKLCEVHFCRVRIDITVTEFCTPAVA